MTYGAPAAPGDLTQPQGSTAVFVDASGRRWRRVRWLGVVLAGLLVAYLVLLAAALVGPPALSRIAVPGLGPLLPGPAAASLGDGRGGSATPREALVRPSPDATTPGGRSTPVPTPGGTSATTGPATSGPAPAPAEPPAPEPAPAPEAPAAPPPSRPAPSATPPAEPARTGQPTARPTPSREPAPASPAARPSEQPSPAAGRPSEQPGQPDDAGTTGTSSTDRPAP